MGERRQLGLFGRESAKSDLSNHVLHSAPRLTAGRRPAPSGKTQSRGIDLRACQRLLPPPRFVRIRASGGNLPSAHRKKARKLSPAEARRMVPMEGVEPTHSYEYQILSLARLPIPPHRLPFHP